MKISINVQDPFNLLIEAKAVILNMTTYFDSSKDTSKLPKLGLRF